MCAWLAVVFARVSGTSSSRAAFANLRVLASRRFLRKCIACPHTREFCANSWCHSSFFGTTLAVGTLTWSVLDCGHRVLLDRRRRE